MQKLLNFKDTREKLGGRSRAAIYNDLAAGRIPQPVKIGGRLYWLESDLDNYLVALSDRAA